MTEVILRILQINRSWFVPSAVVCTVIDKIRFIFSLIACSRQMPEMHLPASNMT